MAKKIFFALFGLLLVIVVGTFVPTAYADCGQPVVHPEGKDCPLYFVQVLVQDENAQPVYNTLVELHLSNGDIQYGVTDRGGIFVFGIPEVWGVDSLALADGQPYNGWSQFKVSGTNCDWFNVSLKAFFIEEPLNNATPVLTTPVGNVSNSNIVSNVVSGPNSAGFNYSNGNWTNTGQIVYDNSMNITNTVYVSVTHVTIEETKPEVLKKMEPRAPISTPPAPKPKPSTPRDDSDQHSRHTPVLETHPAGSNYSLIRLIQQIQEEVENFLLGLAIVAAVVIVVVLIVFFG